ncbi:MAG TPA: CHC2 zinc finger domain-containing protein [Solirubrobacteraceae bacterium]|nr:CHC2 zinc finger domain-containing protein [Solirubrobacteraceae bacterium]
MAAIIARRSVATDVYVGVLPRLRRGGGRDDLVRGGAVLWADCDTPQSVAALRAFRPAPALVVASGTGCHGYWRLSAPATLDDIHDANRCIAAALGADSSCTDPARILRPPTSLNHKRRPPVPVVVERCRAGDRHPLTDIVGGVPEMSRASAPAEGWPAADVLRTISPRRYVEQLAGVPVPRHGKIACPFHDDGTPSLHVYDEPERGWYCYGCGRGGSLYDFAAELWPDTGTRGHDFITLRRRLIHALLAAERVA